MFGYHEKDKGKKGLRKKWWKMQNKNKNKRSLPLKKCEESLGKIRSSTI